MMHDTSNRLRPVKRGAIALTGAALAATLGAASAHAAGAHAASGTQTDSRGTPNSVVWLDNLLHPVDIVEALNVNGPVTSTVGGGDGEYGLSACTGETRMRDVVGRKAHMDHGVFRGRAGKARTKFSLTEQIADQGSVTQAHRKYHRIVRLVSDCQHEPPGHWRYGPAHHLSNKGWQTTYMRAINGDGTRAGGIIVARTGNHLAVVEFFDTQVTKTQIDVLTASTSAQLG